MESYVAFLKRLKADVERQLQGMVEGRYRVFEMSPGRTADRTPEQIANLKHQIQQFEEELKRWTDGQSTDQV
jgi:polyhydroxyalkanoate synthesis regulator phasin